jgi:hypothetical protein
VARLLGAGQRVRIVGREAEVLGRGLEAQGARVLVGPSAGAGPFDAIVLANLLGRSDDPQAVLGALREELEPERGVLIVTLSGIATIGDRLAKVEDGPLGAGSGVLFTEAGLVGLLETAQYAVGHLERFAPAADHGAGLPVHDWLIVAHPLPVPGLDFVQQRMRALAQEAEAARRETEVLRRRSAPLRAAIRCSFPA